MAEHGQAPLSPVASSHLPKMPTGDPWWEGRALQTQRCLPVDGDGSEIDPHAELGSGVWKPSGEHGPWGLSGVAHWQNPPFSLWGPSMSQAARENWAKGAGMSSGPETWIKSTFSSQPGFLLKSGLRLPGSVLGPDFWRLWGWSPNRNAPCSAESGWVSPAGMPNQLETPPSSPTT